MRRRPMRRGPGLVGVAATTAVVAGTAGAVRGHQQKKAYEKQEMAEYEAQQQQMAMEAAAAQAAAQQQAAQPAAPAAAAPVDTAAELERLAQLQQAGVLTPEEFAAAKAKLLGI
jgi:Short C-terminal domain